MVRRDKARASDRERFAAEVIESHFGRPPTRIVEQGGGLTNSVWRVRVKGVHVIVRTHDDATKIDDYRKEHWAMDAARAVGVPVPRVLEIGNVADGRPYMIVERIDGVDGREAKDPNVVLHELGGLAAKLHTVRTRGFGPVFDWSANTLSRHRSWQAWLATGFRIERRFETLARHRMLTERQIATLRTTAKAICGWRKVASLQHGDLRLKNTLIDRKSQRIVALIDWENATSLPPPHYDFSIALHDLGVDGKEAFLDGYGLRPKAYRDALPFIRFFNVLDYADAVEQAAQQKDRARVAALRLRLAGALDLYLDAGD